MLVDIGQVVAERVEPHAGGAHQHIQRAEICHSHRVVRLGQVGGDPARTDRRGGAGQDIRTATDDPHPAAVGDESLGNGRADACAATGNQRCTGHDASAISCRIRAGCRAAAE
jgi:hypothetical protein